MANTYSQLYIHLVFAVKGRENVINKSFKNELYKYICGIVTNKKQKVFSINGVADHIHILVSIGPDYSISDLVKDIKVNSTKWINERKFVVGKFQWQEGFGAFSVSQSQVSKVATYIDNQEEHHKKITFRQEYIDFLKSYNIEYDEKYIFNWED